MTLAVDCYGVAKRFPNEERFGLCDQLRRSASSVPANIAEGHGRGYTKEYMRHLLIARGSLAETETHLELAKRLDYVNETQLENVLERIAKVGKMINALRKSLAKPQLPTPSP